MHLVIILLYLYILYYIRDRPYHCSLYSHIHWELERFFLLLLLLIYYYTPATVVQVVLSRLLASVYVYTADNAVDIGENLDVGILI